MFLYKMAQAPGALHTLISLMENAIFNCESFLFEVGRLDVIDFRSGGNGLAVKSICSSGKSAFVS